MAGLSPTPLITAGSIENLPAGDTYQGLLTPSPSPNPFVFAFQATYVKVNRPREAAATSPFRGLVGGGAETEPTPVLPRAFSAPTAPFWVSQGNGGGGGGGVGGMSRDESGGSV